MDSPFIKDLRVQRKQLERNLSEARAGRSGVGDILLSDGARQLAADIQQAIDNLDASLGIIANTRWT